MIINKRKILIYRKTIHCLIGAVLCLFVASGCGKDRHEEALELCAEAEAELSSGKIHEAARIFSESLKEDPYIARTNFGYADLLYRFKGDYAMAESYYRRALDVLEKDDKLAKLINKRISIMHQVNSGIVEAPEAAVEELIWAAENDAGVVLAGRLSDEFLAAGSRAETPAKEHIEELSKQLKNLYGKVTERDFSTSAAKVKYVENGTIWTFILNRKDKPYWRLVSVTKN